ncbi:growth/differentiation factor 2-like [Lytechinus variegatus]|uniref:growth/differentiation factor 2-like n=1 Tax=Lytechinus variegatus TaxID=7654 RepID=UPI001BB1C0D2|nr:growth/differentiation factor 2-like [Lytechinus variegatus]
MGRGGEVGRHRDARRAAYGPNRRPLHGVKTIHRTGKNDQESNDVDDDEQTEEEDDYSDYSEPKVEGDAERRLLTSFGLSKLPKLDKKAVKEAPSFMLDLYEKLQGSQNDKTSEDFNDADDATPAANTVRSYSETGSRSSGRKTFEFEIRGILDRETIVSAEIVLYKRQSRTSSWEPIPSEDKRAIIEVYHVYRLERKGDVRRRKTLVDQRIIHLSYSGLLQFNVTSAFLNKAQSARLSSDNTSVMTRTFEVKVRARSALIKRMVRFIKFPADNRPEKQPLLVLYLNDNMIQRRDIAMPLGTEGVVAPRRSTRNRLATHSAFTASNRLETRLQNSIELERRLEVAAAVEENSRTDNSGVGREHKALRRKRRAENRASGRPGRTKCQLEQYEVNFEDIGWTTWIVAPRSK